MIRRMGWLRIDWYGFAHTRHWALISDRGWAEWLRRSVFRPR